MPTMPPLSNLIPTGIRKNRRRRRWELRHHRGWMVSSGRWRVQVIQTNNSPQWYTWQTPWLPTHQTTAIVITRALAAVNDMDRWRRIRKHLSLLQLRDHNLNLHHRQRQEHHTLRTFNGWTTPLPLQQIHCPDRMHIMLPIWAHVHTHHVLINCRPIK